MLQVLTSAASEIQQQQQNSSSLDLSLKLYVQQSHFVLLPINFPIGSYGSSLRQLLRIHNVLGGLFLASPYHFCVQP